MNIQLRGGKTAPRLLLDLARYDPRKPSTDGINILTDIPFHQDDQDDTDPALKPRGSCHHIWALKPNQCDLPSDRDYTPSTTISWRFAVCCTRCGSHLDLHIAFPPRATTSMSLRACPTDKYPLHHFIYQPDSSRSRQEYKKTDNDEYGFAWVDRQCFKCTSRLCSATLVIDFKPPRLTAEFITQLTDRFVISTRAEAIMAQNREKYEGVAIPNPATVIGNLSSYIENAMYHPETSKPIKKENKRFSTCFGNQQCSDLFRYLGFEEQDEVWIPPKPDVDSETPYEDPETILLDDVKQELKVLLSKESSIPFSYADNEMKAALACDHYRQTPRARTMDLTIDEHPFYAGLGATGDFHDELLAFAYDCQTTCDPENIPYYLECLQTIAVGRDNSEDLQTKAIIEETEGKISLKDIRQAYASLGLRLDDTQLADENIIGIFQARIADAPRQEAEMRKHLRIVGQHRSSRRIELVASQDVSTYIQALHFLDIEETLADEFIPTIVSVKIAEKPSDEFTTRQAVALIANHRKSKALKTYLDTGTLGEAEMDIGQAYSRLNVMDRTVGEELILTAYDIIVEEQPSQIDELNRALTAIAKSRNSSTLKARLGIDDDGKSHNLADWPVGIENIGNTCYLNSLLQFYFTIKPLRAMVLDIDTYKMTADDEESLKSKRVGSRNVSKKEVDRAQRFVEELRRLFNDLIASPKASLKPNPDVARLTLLSSTKAEQARRQSMIAADRPNMGFLGTVNGRAVQGPMGPPSAAEGDQVDSEMRDTRDIPIPSRESDENDGHSDTSSGTLVEGTIEGIMEIDAQSAETQQKIFEDKENLPPSKTDLNPEDMEDVDLTPLGPASPSRLNEQAHVASKDGEDSTIPELVEATADKIEPEMTTSPTGLPPNRPPPFPPRPRTQQDASEAIKEAEYGAQQDVTEVIANVLFQLQCAIKSEAVDETGEQLDQVKRLFFGKSKSYTTNRRGSIRTKEEYMSDIKVDVASGPRDIYDALDGAFDVQDVEIGGGIEPQYATISQLPPVLSILIQRAQFDPEKKTTFKSDNHLELKETIYMDRYMDSSEPSLNERRQESWAWKRQLAALEKRRNQLATSDMDMDVPEILMTTRAYLQQVKDLDDEEVEVPDSLMDNLESAAEESKQELEALESQIKDLRTNISSQFSDLRKIPYRLASVFIHVGSHNTGHYWIYIYDFATKIWRKYNDEKITEVTDTKEIFEAPGTNRPPTPYYVVYVKDDEKELLVDPVCRDVIEPPPEEKPQEVEMEDYTDIIMPDTAAEMIEDTYASLNRPRTQQEQVEYDAPQGKGPWDNGTSYKTGIPW